MSNNDILAIFSYLYSCFQLHVIALFFYERPLYLLVLSTFMSFLASMSISNIYGFFS